MPINIRMRRIVLMLLLLAGLGALLFGGAPSRPSSDKHLPDTSQDESPSSEKNKQSGPLLRGRVMHEPETGFTLDELLNSPTQVAEEDGEGMGASADRLAEGQTVRARGLEGSSDLPNRGYGNDSFQSTSGSPAIDALREIEQSSQNGRGSFLGGVRASGSGAVIEPTPLAPVATVKATATPSADLERVGGQARGFTMLYLMHPRARATVEKQIETLLRAQVQDVYLAVLTDGTFSKDFAYLSDVIRRLSRANRSVTLVVYLTNGATMRNFASNVSDEGFNNIDPTEFRSLIRFDASTRDRFVRLIRPVIPAMLLNRRLNESSRNFAVVMLEDNLDDDSYLAMRRLAETVIGNRATFIRNPCPGCWEGNTSNTFGDGLELHRPEDIDSLNSRDGFSLDGYGYVLNESAETSTQPLSYEATRELIIRAASRGLRYFGLWRFERQGLRLGQPVIPPEEREYEVPSESDALLEIDLLRAGLAPVLK